MMKLLAQLERITKCWHRDKSWKR